MSFPPFESCIKISEIERMSIVDGCIEVDDWNVETTITLVGDLSNNYQVLSDDFDGSMATVQTLNTDILILTLLVK